MLEPAQLHALKAVEAETGASVSEQIRRGIQLWLESKGVKAKPAPRRAGARRKA